MKLDTVYLGMILTYSRGGFKFNKKYLILNLVVGDHDQGDWKMAEELPNRKG